MASNFKDKNSLKNISVPNLNDAKSFEDILRCPICFDYFDNCMMTKCSHNFCSVCIRRYMLYKAQCPTCFQEASEPELRNNRLIDEVLHIYTKTKDVKVESDDGPSDLSKPVFVQIETEPAPSSSSSYLSRSTSSKSADSDDVSCPVCYKTVSLQRVNVHLDNCLKSNDLDQESEKRRPLPKLVYHLLSEKELKKKLKELGLNAFGDKQTLIRRHKNFLVMHNANCDSLSPKSDSELLREFELQELEERGNLTPKQTQINKKSDMSLIERERRAYLKEHQSQFNELIQNIHERRFERPNTNQRQDENFEEQDEETSLDSSASGNFNSSCDQMKSSAYRKRKNSKLRTDAEGRLSSPKKL